MADNEPSLQYENHLCGKGYKHIAGVDEAGRGPLAGPVTAAAVVFPGDIDSHVLSGVRDSKQLTERARERLYDLITENALAYAVACVSPQEIDAINIRQGALLAMRRAVENLYVKPDYVLVDGRDCPDFGIPGEAIVKGDGKSITIGAASILAKVARDRIMDSYHQRFPHYGLDRHKGYPTQYHRDALQLFGASAIHRATFAHVPDKRFVPNPSLEFREFVNRFEPEMEIEAYHALKNELASLPLSEMERKYLNSRIKYGLDAAKKTARLLKPATVDVGEDKETLAADLLTQKGYRLWERNYHCREGEIDLIANKDSLLVFVEVKSRASARFGMPYEAVTASKRKKIIRSADRYLYERGLLEGWDVRYDIVSILAPKNQPPQIEHFEDAFRVEGELD